MALSCSNSASDMWVLEKCYFTNMFCFGFCLKLQIKQVLIGMKQYVEYTMLEYYSTIILHGRIFYFIFLYFIFVKGLTDSNFTAKHCSFQFYAHA